MIERLSAASNNTAFNEGYCLDFDGHGPQPGCERDYDVRWAPGTGRLVAGMGARLAAMGELSQAAYDALDGAALQRITYDAADVAVPATIRSAVAIRTANGHYIMLRRLDDGEAHRKYFFFQHVEFGPRSRAPVP